MLSPETYARVSDLVSEALDLDASERCDFLTKACGDEPEIRHEVEALLAHEADLDDGFLEVSAISEFRRDQKVVKPAGTGAVSIRELLDSDTEAAAK